MQLFGLKTCDTCRKARKALPQAQFIDVRDHGVPAKMLVRAHSLFGAALLNTRSTTWRDLKAAERALPPVELLKTHPTAMKRPLVVVGDRMYLGWSPEVRQALEVS
ncbi:MAG: ArsC/Spx/MgsR family protein [Pseudomonadota bacterium]